MPLCCPGCRAPVNVPPHLLGATLRCRQCGEVFAATSADEPPVVPAAGDPRPDGRIQERFIPAIPKVPRREPRVRSAPAPVHKRYGLYVAIALLLVMMTAGVLVAGGIIWWLAGRSAPQAAGPIAAARGNPAPLDDPFPALAPDAPAAPAQPRLRPDWGGPFDGRAPGFDPFPGFGGNV